MDTSDGLLTVEKDENGKISMISADSAAMNKISVGASMEAQKLLSDVGSARIAVPLGNISGIDMLSGIGPSVVIEAVPMGAVTTSFRTQFETAGINQTRYRTYISMKAFMKIVLGLSAQTVEVNTEVLVSDAIIVGDVPATYADVSNGSDFMNLMP